MAQTLSLPTGAQFDAARADRVINFFERILVHTKGRYARQPFILSPWEIEIIRKIFGTVRYDDQWKDYVRQFTLAWIEVARKNGKSELLAGIALYLLIADGEEAAEVYGAASDREQASMVYRVAKRMCELSAPLSKMVDKKQLFIIDSRKRIVFAPTDSFYQVVAADAAGNLGANPHGIVFDEVLTQPNRDLWDALGQGMGTRVQPLLASATTAGNDPTSFCFTEHEFGLRVAEDPDLDPSRYVFIRSVPMEADWRDEGVWPEGNPALGDFLNIQALRTEALRVANGGDLVAQANFRQYRLNQWQRNAHRWLDMVVWDESGREAGEFEPEDLLHSKGYGGLDLAETDDFSSWVVVFPEEDGPTRVHARFWIPREAISRKHKRIESFLLAWEAQGFLTVTEGSTVDYDKIQSDILADLELFHVEEIGYDPWNAISVVQEIEANTDTKCVKVGQTTTRMNAPSKELTRLLGRRELAHNGNPILRWMADNVEAQSDRDGNIKPSKSKSPEKIDGIVAMVNALFCVVRERDEGPEAGIYVMEDDDE